MEESRLGNQVVTGFHSASASCQMPGLGLLTLALGTLFPHLEHEGADAISGLLKAL